VKRNKKSPMESSQGERVGERKKKEEQERGSGTSWWVSHVE
jgi:hypothetical protein